MSENTLLLIEFRTFTFPEMCVFTYFLPMINEPAENTNVIFTFQKTLLNV